MKVHVLGPIAASSTDGPCELGGPKQRRLLAALVVDGPTASADRLVERVWGDEQPSDPQNSLRTAMTRLRHALGEGSILTSPDGWRLESEVTTDAAEFARLVETAGEPELDVHGRLMILDEALALWRGDAFGEFADEEWARAEAHRLEELRLIAVEKRYDAMLAAGMHTDMIPGVSADAAAYPLRDRLVGLRMLALYRSGRRAEATRAFQDHRDRLAEELGLVPGPELIDLDRRIVATDSSLELVVPAGRPLRGYRLGEQLGEGAFATVFRGTQPSVGRDVAVKMIRSQLANRPEFIRRFEAEAHLVARLEHPYIVPLYDYWREPDRACLVFRYLRGGTLEQRLASTSGLPLDECVTMVEQVGAALAEAHLAGVVHRDVKPANVLLDERGNFYLGDFGIALEAAEVSDPSAALSAGSPAYASPEQLRREPVGPAADVHGLGISLYEALTGRLPFPDAASHAQLLEQQLSTPIPAVRERRTDVPAAVDEVIKQATAKDPVDRYQSVEQFVAELQVAAGRRSEPAASTKVGSATIISTADGHNPYKGLNAFTEADAVEFFGRERLVERMIESLSQPGSPGRVLAVVGPSGIGKSSAVRAGLLPSLRNGAVFGSDQWLMATVLPGSDPFEEVAAALMRVATSVPDKLMTQLTDDHRGLSRVAKAMTPEGAVVLLVIDQFEELFTMTDAAMAKRFLDALEYAATDARCPLRIVLTVRADFWDRPLRHGSFARLIDDSIVNVTALAPDELERAIVAPAARSGGEFEPGLVSEIVADIADQPGALPLLQYALTQLWEQRVSQLLTRASYQELGGVAGALASRAEELHEAMSAEEQIILRRICGRLVSLGDGTEDTRRRALRSELGNEAEVETVLERFGAARLLSFDRDDKTREPNVEVAHEALTREWPRLRGWIDEDRDGLRIVRHLHRAATEWDSTGRPESELYRGGRLDTAEHWAADRGSELTALEGTFLTASIDVRERAAEVEREQLDNERRANRRLRTLLASVAVVAALALIAGAVAVNRQREATRQSEVAGAAAVEADQQRLLAVDASAAAEEAAADADQTRFTADIRRMVSDARDLDETNPPLAMLVAASAYSADPTPQTLGALQDALARTDGFLGRLGTDRDILDVGFVGESTVVTRTSDELELWDLEEGTSETLASLADISDMVVSGSLVALLDVAGTVTLFDTSSGLTTEAQTGVAGPAARVAVDSVSGRVAVVDSVSIEVYDRGFGPIWSADINETVPDPRGCDVCVATALMGDDLYVAVGAEIVRFDAAGELKYRADPASFNDELPDDWQSRGQVAELVGDAENGRMWAKDSAQLLLYINIDDGSLGEVRSGPQLFPALTVAGGRLLHGVDLLDVESGIDRPFEWFDSVPASSALSPDGRTVILAGGDGLAMWAVDGRGPISRVAPTPGANVASLDATDNIVSWSAWPTGVHGLFDLESNSIIRPDLGNAWMQNWLPSGSLTTWGLDGRSSVWSSESFAEISGDLPLQSWSFFGTTPDEERALFGEISGPSAGAITIRDLRTGEALFEVDDLLAAGVTGAESPGLVFWLHFSPDGSMAAGHRSRGSLGLWDTTDWTLQREVDVGDQITGEVFSHDGETLAMHTTSGQLFFLDLETGSVEPGPLAGATEATSFMASMAYSPDDRRLLLGVPQGLEVWDVASEQQIGSMLPNNGLAFGTTSYDGQFGITVIDDRTHVWDLEVDNYLDVACRAAGREMTEAEWLQFGLTDEPFVAVCADSLGGATT